jgi:hypothetical protein
MKGVNILASPLKLSDRAIVLGDHSHATDELKDWSERAGQRFLFWSEEPVGRWYPGAGIGFSHPR